MADPDDLNNEKASEAANDQQEKKEVTDESAKETQKEEKNTSKPKWVKPKITPQIMTDIDIDQLMQHLASAHIKYQETNQGVKFLIAGNKEVYFISEIVEKKEIKRSIEKKEKTANSESTKVVLPDISESTF